MTQPAKKIAIIDGASGAQVEGLFRTLVERWGPGVRLAGAIAEDHGLADRACNAGYLRSLGSDRRFAIFQDLGPGSQTCHLEGAGALSAAEQIRRDIARGCDLVLLSKFGTLEAAGKGLRGAFEAAIDAGMPILTSVSPRFRAAWDGFAAPLFTVLAADIDRVEAWRHAVCSPAADREQTVFHQRGLQ